MRGPLSEALAALGVDRLVCAVHDRSLPSLAGEDHGCGSPAGRGAEDFLDFLAEQGFTGLQLGPPGHVALDNLSPYDGTAMSRSTLQLAAAPLVEGEHGARLLPASFLSPPPPRGPAERCDYERAFAWQARLLDELHRRWDELLAAGGAEARALQERLGAFRRREAWWLDGDALHRALSRRFNTPDSTGWPDAHAASLFASDPEATPPPALLREHAAEVERYAREQMLAHEQHLAFLRKARARGLRLSGDLQVGLSHAERWRWASLMLRGFWMGAPPSRTNPQGQPWGYPVLNPALYGDRGRPGPALAFLRRRLDKMFREYDAVRIDHPHGLVCPWVYRNLPGDPFAAVRAGARLFSAGPWADPALAALDIARPEQLATDRAPWADDWVKSLDGAQVDRYALAVDALVDAARDVGADASALVCEVLSTMPAPLGRVIERHDLGRFRVTSKADVRRPDDVYLPTNAREPDWIMVGTHDTRPLWLVVDEWSETTVRERAAFAASCLAPDGEGSEQLARRFAGSRAALASAELAVLFTSRARSVMVFASDLLGERQVYNWPGEIRPENWTLRVPSSYRELHAQRAGEGRALDVAAALSLALGSLPRDQRQQREPLRRALSRGAAAVTPEPR